MHEYHIVESLVKQIEEKAKEQDAKRVTKVVLVIGESSGLSESSIRLYFETIAEDSFLHDAELVFKNIPSHFMCPTCDKTFPKTKDFLCPTCKGEVKPTDKGKEFFIETIETE